MAPPLVSKYDKPVLTLLAEHGPVTLKVLAHHFTHRPGDPKDPSHFIATMRTMRSKRRGLVVGTRQFPYRGMASRQVLDITPMGWEFIQALDVTPLYPHDAPRDWLIARSSLIVSSLARGYTHVTGPSVFQALRADAVATILAGTERERKGLPLRLLKNAPGFNMGLEALVSRDGMVTLLFPAHSAERWKGRLTRMTSTRTATGKLVDDPNARSGLLQVSAVRPLRFLVLATDRALEQGALKGLRRWAKDIGPDITTDTCPLHHLAGLPTRPPHASRAREGAIPGG
jgi:hypothetical protein